VVSFSIEGRPQPAGSKRAFPRKRKDGRLAVSVVDMNPNAAGWKAHIRERAANAFPCLGLPAMNGEPVGLSVDFYFERPRSHYRTGRFAHLLKPSAPIRPTVKPDTTKVLRALEDALTGIAWKDDAQVVDQRARKFYGDPHVVVRVYGPDDLWLMA
jgi:Holliday junction resolvase RusA-like endonuclease